MTGWFCYVLRNTNEKYKNLTYIGSSNDPFERLKKHNGELAGGAKYTKGKGEWEIYMLFSGFDSYSDVLSFEWRLKHPKGCKNSGSKFCGIKGKIESLNYIITLDTWGKKNNLIKTLNIKLFIVNDILDNLDVKIIDHLEMIKVNNITSQLTEI